MAPKEAGEAAPMREVQEPVLGEEKVSYPERKRLASVAFAAIRKAIRAGSLKKLDGSVNCVDCGRPAELYDHRDYRDYLKVQPVCRRCNVKRGSALPPAEKPRVFCSSYGRSAKERFFEKVDKNGPYNEILKSRCWIWMGAIATWGYGQFHVYGSGKARVRTSAHRYSFEIHKEKIRKGFTPDHLCKNTTCVNPDHMEVVLERENIYRSNCLGAINRRKVFCKNGHFFDKDNTLVQFDAGHPRGHRRCRMCEAERYKRNRLA
jgi:hypothetical protein